MEQLTPNWFSEGIIDFEHKKYVLLGYLQHVSKQFDESKLYPFLSDLIFHYQTLVDLQTNQQQVKEHFPKKLSKLDFESFRLQYEKMMNDEDYMVEIESILAYAIPRLMDSLKEGKSIYEYVEDNIAIEPIGILPLNKSFGYMILSNGEKNRLAKVYEYELSFYESAHEKYRSLRTHFVNEYTRKITQTYESIKIDLIRTHKKLPNPATYLINSQVQFPLTETLLPIAKRSLVRYIVTKE